MKNNMLFFVAVFSTLNGADKNNRLNLSFSDSKLGSYNISTLKKSQTFKNMLEDIDILSPDPIFLPFNKEYFDAIYALMEMKSDKRTSVLAHSNKKDILALSEVANFLDAPQKIMNALIERLFKITFSEIGEFIQEPDTYLSQFNSTITNLLSHKLYKHRSTQNSLLKAALHIPPFKHVYNKKIIISNISLSLKDHMAISYPDGHIEIFDLNNNQKIDEASVGINIFAINFSQDGNQLMIAGSNRTMHIWDLEKKQLIQSSQSEIRYDRKHQYRMIIFSPDNKYLFWSPWNGSVEVIDTHTGLRVKTLNISNNNIPVTAIDCSSNGYLAVAYQGKINIIELSDFQTRASINTNNNSEALTLSFSKDNAQLAVGYADRQIQIYTLKIVQPIEYKQTFSTPPNLKSAPDLYTQSLDFSSHNRWLACQEKWDKTTIWDISKQTILKIISESNKYGMALFSRSGNFIVTSSGPLCKYWNIEIIKHRLPFGVLILLYLFETSTKEYIAQFNKKKMQQCITSQSNLIDDLNDRKIIFTYLMDKLNEDSLLQKAKKAFKKIA